MKVTFQTCCGVDIHKSFLVATIIKTTGGIEPSYQKRRFSTFNNSILEFKKWLLENECLYVCMESTGKYWIPVFNLLENEINVTIANPKWVKAVKGNKDDTKDSKWIGDLFRLGLVRGSYIPCKKIRILRKFTRYRYKLVSCRSSEKNRYQNALTVCNVALDSVVSDVFGKSSTSIIDYLLGQSGTSIDHEVIASKLLKRLNTLVPGTLTILIFWGSHHIEPVGTHFEPPSLSPWSLPRFVKFAHSWENIIWLVAAVFGIFSCGFSCKYKRCLDTCIDAR